jgi:hypothetical protein
LIVTTLAKARDTANCSRVFVHLGVVVEVMHLMDSFHGSAATEGVVGEPEFAVSYWNGVLLAIVGDFICPPGDIELCFLLLVSNVTNQPKKAWFVPQFLNYLGNIFI